MWVKLNHPDNMLTMAAVYGSPCMCICYKTYPIESLMTLSTVRLWKQELMPNAY